MTRPHFSNGECHNCGHFFVNDTLMEGWCEDCRAADPANWPEDSTTDPDPTCALPIVTIPENTTP